ncbi:MAG: 3-hydroxyacyl-CoA dehydrogenase family protein [Cyclobacteriaceae bacterium]
MKNVCVIGGGTMGNGIAHVMAQFGYHVTLYDLKQEILEKAVSKISQNMDRQIKKELLSEDQKKQALARLQISTELAEAVKEAELVIEAATENFDIKKKIFEQLDSLCPENCLLATNTSSISITRIAACTKRPQNVIGMHFMNPVPVMRLVEIIRGYSTSDESTAMVEQVSRKIEKVPLTVNDYPGFISNRILMPMINEAIYSLFEGVAGVKEIDEIMQLGMAHPMGPLRLADFIGLDVCLSILQVMQEGFGNPKYAPCPLLVNMVAANTLGMKSGVGFYDYRENPREPKLARQFA